MATLLRHSRVNRQLRYEPGTTQAERITLGVIV
jgi:hypothetical protein